MFHLEFHDKWSRISTFSTILDCHGLRFSNSSARVCCCLFGDLSIFKYRRLSTYFRMFFKHCVTHNISIDEMTELNNSFLSNRVLLLWWISLDFDPSRSTTSHYKFDYLRQFSMLPKKRDWWDVSMYVRTYTLCCFSTCREEDILWLHENNRKNVWLLCRIHFCSDLKDALLIFLYVPYGLVFFLKINVEKCNQIAVEHFLENLVW